MVAKVKKTSEGVCPYCGKENTDVIDWDIYGGNELYRKYRCNICDETFGEWFSIVYESYEDSDYNLYSDNANYVVNLKTGAVADMSA